MLFTVLSACAVVFACANRTMVSGNPDRATTREGEMAIDWQRFACPRGQLFDGALRIAQRYNLRVETLEKESGFIEFKLGQLDVNQLSLYTRFPTVSEEEGYAIGGYRDYLEYYGFEPVGSVDLTFLMTPKGRGVVELAVRSHWQTNVGTYGQKLTKVDSSGFFEDQLVTELAREASCPMVGRWSTDAQKKLGRLRSLAEQNLLDGDDYWIARTALLREGDDDS